MADFDICNVYKRRPSKRKGDKSAKKHKGPSFKTFLETRQKYGVDGTRSDTEDSDSDDYSTRRNKKKPKLLYSEFNKRRQSEEVSDVKERDESLDEPATNNTSFSTEPSAEPEPITVLNEKLEATCIELSDDEDISYSFPPRVTQDPPPLRPPPPVVPSIEEMTDLDPDLMKIVTAPTAAHNPSAAHPTSAAKLEKVCIKVQYVNLKKIDDRVMLEAIRRMEEPLKVYLMENDPFEKLLQWFCSKRLLAKNNILLVYDDTPVMPRATPASLHMITGKKGKNLIKAYIKEDYKKHMEEESEMIQRQLHESPFGDEKFEANMEEAAPVDEEVMRIKLQGKNNDDFNIRVKKTTLLRSIAKRYIEVKELGSAAIEKIRLSFDGEDLSLNDTIADTDLEDEDVVTVIVS